MSTHAQGTDLGGGGGGGGGGGVVERVRARRHCAPLRSKLVAAVSGSICVHDSTANVAGGQPMVVIIAGACHTALANRVNLRPCFT